MDSDFVASAVAAIETELAGALVTTPGALREAAEKRRRTLSLEYNRVLASGAFGDGRGYDAAAAAATQGDGNSQYGFDPMLASFFSLLADARLPRDQTRACSQQLGVRLLAMLQAQPPATGASATAAPPRLAELLGGMRTLLEQLQKVGYVASWSLDDSDADEALWRQRSDLSLTRLSVTLNDSASLRAALLLNGRGAAASPELAKPMLLAYLRSRGCVVTEVNEYFLDSVYRSSPLEYRPNQQILTLTVAPS